MSYWSRWNSITTDDGMLKPVLEIGDGSSYRKQLVTGSSADVFFRFIFALELRLLCNPKFGCTPGKHFAGEVYITNFPRKMEDAVSSGMFISSKKENQ